MICRAIICRTTICRNMIRSMICHIKIRSLNLFSTSLLILLLASLAFGQGGASTGDLQVTVKDAGGNLVNNATVTVSDVAKGLARTATGDNQGGYSARQLPPGIYTVTVQAPGFGKAEDKNVSITVGGLVDLPIALVVATGKEVVEVTSQQELIETSRTSTTNTIGQLSIDNLPINGRNYINFTLTDSQVVARQFALSGRSAHLRIEHQRPARPLQPGQRRWRRCHRQLHQRRPLHRVPGSGAGISDHYQQLRPRIWPRRRRRR